MVIYFFFSKVLTYDGELLFQKYHDHVVITLLTESIEDSAVDKYTTTKPKGLKRTDLSDGARKKTSGFSAGTAFTGNAKVSLKYTLDLLRIDNVCILSIPSFP